MQTITQRGLTSIVLLLIFVAFNTCHTATDSRQSSNSPLVTPPDIKRMKESPSLIREYYHRDRERLAARLGEYSGTLNETELQLIYCTIVAHAWAHYGPSTATTYSELLTAPDLNCGNYGLLTSYLAEEIGALPSQENRLRFVGWDGGEFGNHQMLFVDRVADGQSLLLDPTIGLVVVTSYDDVAGGIPVSAEQMFQFAVRDDLKAFREHVSQVLLSGHCKPSDLLYYFEGREHLLKRYGNPQNWPTPGAIPLRQRLAAATSGSTETL